MFISANLSAAVFAFAAVLSSSAFASLLLSLVVNHQPAKSDNPTSKAPIGLLIIANFNIANSLATATKTGPNAAKPKLMEPINASNGPITATKPATITITCLVPVLKFINAVVHSFNLSKPAIKGGSNIFPI